MARWQSKEEYERWKAERMKQVGKMKEKATDIPRESPPQKKMNSTNNIPHRARTFGTKEKIAIAGSIMMSIGVFLPFVKLPLIGSMNYFYNGKSGGGILLVLAAGSVVLVLIDKMRWLWVTATASALTFSYSLYLLLQGIDEMKKKADTSFIIGTMADSIQIEIGVPVIVVSIILLYVSAYLNQKQPCPSGSETANMS